ncbi:MAG: S24 family peptidase [Pseudomonadota bacterium]
MTQKPFPIPVVPAADDAPEQDLATSACASGEPYALMVLGDSMLPEFEEGEIIVIEPEGLARDGSFVIAYLEEIDNEAERHIFRQLVQHPDGWMLKPLNPLYPNVAIRGLEVVKGVVIMKKKPGRRRAMKTYA